MRAGTLTDDQLARIRAVDKVKRDVRKQTVESDLDGYRILFVGGPGKKSVLESASKRQDVVQYILVLLSDLLDSMSLPLSLPLAARLTDWPVASQTFPPCPKPSYGPVTRTGNSFLSSPTPPTPKTPSRCSRRPC